MAKDTSPEINIKLNSDEFSTELDKLAKVSDTFFSSLNTSIETAGEAMSGLTGETEAFSSTIDTVIGVVTAAQTAVTLFTSALQLASAAQTILNAVMSENIIAIVIISVAALTAGIAALCAIQDAETESEKELAESQERLCDTQTNLGESYGNIFSKMGDFKDSISSATSYLDALSEAYGISSTKQNELSSTISECQAQITAIYANAAAERGYLTDEEIAKIEELMGAQKKAESSQLETYDKISAGLQNYARTVVENMSADEIAAEAENVAKSAQESYDSITEAAKNYMISEYGRLEQQKEIGELTQAEYDKGCTDATEAYQTKVSAAQAEMDETNAIMAEGYAAKSDTLQNWQDENAEHLANLYAEQEDYESRKTELEVAANTEQLDNKFKLWGKETEAQTAYEEFQAAHKDTLSEIYGGISASMDESTANQLASLLGMTVGMGQSYDEMGSQTQGIIDSMLALFSSLDEDGRNIMNQALSGMGMEISKGGELLYTSTDDSCKKVVESWSKNDSYAIDAARNTAFGMGSQLEWLDKKAGITGTSSSNLLSNSWASNQGLNVNAVQSTVTGMANELDKLEGDSSKSSKKAALQLCESWQANDNIMVQATQNTVDKMGNVTEGSKLIGPTMGPIGGAYSSAVNARNTVQNYLDWNPAYLNVYTRTHYSGGRNATGGVTGYAKGGREHREPENQQARGRRFYKTDPALGSHNRHQRVWGSRTRSPAPFKGIRL